MADTSSIDFALGERPARTFLRASDSRLTDRILQRREFGKSRRAVMALEGFSGMIQRCVDKPIPGNDHCQRFTAAVERTATRNQAECTL